MVGNSTEQNARVRSPLAALQMFTAAIRPNRFQFSLQIVLVIMIGALVSICKLTQGYMTWSDKNGNGTQDWEDEKGEFLVDGTLRSTQFLVAFGLSKAITNFIVGITCDIYGRKPVMIVGWVFGLVIPIMVIFASSWEVVVASNVFLGIQQGLCWSLTIFMMVDYAGAENRGLAVGLNETMGYTAIAIFTKVSAAIINEDSRADINYRTDNYYIAISLVVAGLLISVFLMRDTIALVKYEGTIVRPSPASRALDMGTGAHTKGDYACMTYKAFIQCTFLNRSLMACCQAGLMINFTTAFAWGIMTKWLKDYGNAPRWTAFSKDDAADIILAYGLAKGVLQFVFGFGSDRIGRKVPIVGGLLTVCASMLVFYIIGELVDGQETARSAFIFAAFLLGLGTAMMYPNVIAAACEHSSPSWRASAMGTYRFWRDSGYWIGGLTLGAIADASNVSTAIITMAVLCAVSAVLFFVLYREKVEAHIDMAELTRKAHGGYEERRETDNTPDSSQGDEGDNGEMVEAKVDQVEIAAQV
eukprot:GEMP01003821.1.p1 GENE.GEMP01003821.1~~GEMP01003821.1.p1  ORF type:complete len:560 (+),score=147.25 GEMP01003821.1:94-1680(+)